MTEKQDIAIYRKYLNGLIESNSSELFFNENKEHASAVMACIFRNSKDIVRIMAKSLSGDVSGNDEYRSALFGFLNKGGKLKVLLNGYTPDILNTSKILSVFKAHNSLAPANRVVVKNAHGLRFTLSSTGNEAHFTVGDNRLYRVEKDVEKYTAFGSFNDSSACNKLIESFDLAFDSPNHSVIPV